MTADESSCARRRSAGGRNVSLVCHRLFAGPSPYIIRAERR
ncbi:hypothetical protein BN2537_3021 [Streptomyces venezuelae]|nr:hypothetical protein BN2537_3021 [Streptomyces venezuelae]